MFLFSSTVSSLKVDLNWLPLPITNKIETLEVPLGYYKNWLQRELLDFDCSLSISCCSCCDYEK